MEWLPIMTFFGLLVLIPMVLGVRYLNQKSCEVSKYFGFSLHSSKRPHWRWTPRHLEGTYLGRKVAIRFWFSGSYLTNISTTVGGLPTGHINVFRNSMINTALSKVSQTQVMLGDETFDAHFIVMTSDAQQARDWLTTERRSLLINATDKYEDTTIFMSLETQKLSMMIRGLVSIESVRRLLDAQADFAARLEQIDEETDETDEGNVF